MKNNEDKFDIIVDRLHQHKPKPDNADVLTNSIMQVLMNQSQRSTSKFLIFVRVVSSSAAVLLLGLFLFQQNGTELVASAHKPMPILENKINVDSLCIQRLSNKRVNLLETYFCYMQKNSIKNKQLRAYAQLIKN